MSIQTRTVFYEINNGLATFQDWALCKTTLGTMAEPFIVNQRKIQDTIGDFDATDEASRIDEIMAVNSDKLPKILSGGIDALIGGIQMPRVGR